MNRIFRHKALHSHEFLAGALLLIFSFYYINITLFSHYHVVDGVTIVHSHIHSDDHTSEDAPAHTRSELTLIQHLSNFIVELQSTISFATPLLLSIVWSYAALSAVTYISHNCSYKRLRAPPAELSIG